MLANILTIFSLIANRINSDGVHMIWQKLFNCQRDKIKIGTQVISFKMKLIVTLLAASSVLLMAEFSESAPVPGPFMPYVIFPGYPNYHKIDRIPHLRHRG